MQPSNGRAVAVMATVTALCAGTWSVISAQQSGTGKPPTFRSGVELVTVDVTVLDRQGHPLKGLAPADFVVTVGGQPRRVVSAEFVDVTAARPDPVVRADGTAISTNEGAG